jgi:hypothetical protein
MANTTQEILLEKIKDSVRGVLHPASVKLIDDTAPSLGPYYAIQALQDTVIDVSASSMNIVDADADFTIPRGVTIYGEFTFITLGSGKVLAYTK